MRRPDKRICGDILVWYRDDDSVVQLEPSDYYLRGRLVTLHSAFTRDPQHFDCPTTRDASRCVEALLRYDETIDSVYRWEI